MNFSAGSDHGWVWAVVAAGAGWLGGHTVPRFVRGAVNPPFQTTRRLIGISAAVGTLLAVFTWLWQVQFAGQVPPGIGDGDGLGERWAATVVLFWLLAASAWVDLRDRVIPDAITVPGVLAGLLWNAVHPGGLLPVVREEARSFAPPARHFDVLGLCGPLHGPWPDWLASAPAAPGLLVSVIALAAWCLIGTEPPGAAEHPSRRPFWAADRTWAVACGLGLVVAAWFVGGDHWRGMATALGGAVIAAGIVWLTREAASRAIGQEAMGLGDVTLMAMMGAWLGWQPCVLVCLGGVFIGLVHGIFQFVTRRESELPFGPSLCLSCVAVVEGWRAIWQSAGPAFERPAEMAAVVAAVVLLTGLSLWAWRRIRPVTGG